MIRLCRACEGWHSLEEAWPSACSSHFQAATARSDLPHPMVISDSLDGLQSMVDGQRYDSKSALRASYKRAGVMEVGNDIDATLKLAAQKPDRPKVTKREIHSALQKVKQGYRPNLPAD
jgi:hypothetical protein